MHVNVGPFRYSVTLVRGYIDHEGQRCYGLCDNVAQQILISDVPPEPQRLQVFFHELMHAWWYHFGVEPGDEEAVADLVGVAMTDFVLQATAALRGQGAPLTAAAEDENHAALWRLALGPVAPRKPPPRDQPAAGSGRRSPFEPAALTAAPPRRSPAPGEFQRLKPAAAPLRPARTNSDAGWTVRLYRPLGT